MPPGNPLSLDESPSYSRNPFRSICNTLCLFPVTGRPTPFNGATLAAYVASRQCVCSFVPLWKRVPQSVESAMSTVYGFRKKKGTHHDNALRRLSTGRLVKTHLKRRLASKRTAFRWSSCRCPIEAYLVALLRHRYREPYRPDENLSVARCSTLLSCQKAVERGGEAPPVQKLDRSPYLTRCTFDLVLHRFSAVSSHSLKRGKSTLEYLQFWTPKRLSTRPGRPRTAVSPATSCQVLVKLLQVAGQPKSSLDQRKCTKSRLLGDLAPRQTAISATFRAP